MSMTIQDTFSNCCEGFKGFVSNTTSWIGKTVTTIGTLMSESAQKVAEFAKPHFGNFKTFVQENRGSILLASIGFIVGAIATAIFDNVFYRGANTGASSTASPPPST
jgi:hypothetical protein